MATSGSKSVTVTSWDTLKFSWWQSSQSVANNTTTIGWKLELVSGSSGYISSTTSKSWSVSVAGKNYSGTNTVGIANNTTKTLASGSTTISHNADGTKSFSYSFSQYFGITFSGASIGTISGSGSGTLNTIPRASQPSCITWPNTTQNVGNIGGTITIHMNRASSAFTHTVRYAWGNKSANIATGVGGNTSWTIPLNFMDNIPNATSGVGTIYVDTYNGSTHIGTKSVSFTATVPASVVPSIGTVTTSEATSGLAAQFGAYVQNKSKITANISAAGAYSSTIKSYSTSFQGKVYTGSSWTSDLLTRSGTLDLVITVKDSRDRTATKTVTISVQAYSLPQVHAFTVDRCRADGTPDPDGTHALVAYSYSVASVGGKNTAAVKIDFKRFTAQAYAAGDVIMTGSQLAATGSVVSTAVFSLDYQYDIRLTVTDWFGASAPYTATLQSDDVILDIKANGRGLGVGQTAEEDDTLAVAASWVLKMKNAAVTDFVVESGSNETTLWRKWASGLAECFIFKSVSVAVQTAYGSGYYNGSVLKQAFPFTFTSTPHIFASCQATNAQIYNISIAHAEKTDVSFYISSMQAQASAAVYARFYAVGHWK